MNELRRHREMKDRYFATATDSPLARTAGFTGLAYFDEDPALRIETNLDPADGSQMRVQTSDGQERIHTRDATVTLAIEGTAVTLTLYGTGHGSALFLPFRDATSGKESYGAGRYLDIDDPRDGSVTIDFNLAYNPYCAYSDSYSCPLPPAENWLSVPVRAGERSYPR